MDYLVCHKRNYGNFPETEDTISETTIDFAGIEQAVLHFYNHDSYLAAHDWIEIHPILHGRPHQAVPIPPARYQSQVESAEIQKGLNVVNRLTLQLDSLKTDRAFLAIDRGDLWALQRALSASQHREATPRGDKINGVPVSELKEIEEKLGLRPNNGFWNPDRAEAEGQKPWDWDKLEAHRKSVEALGSRSPNEIQHATTTAGQQVNFTHTLESPASETLGVTPITADVADRAATLLAKLDEQAEAYGEYRMVQLSDADVQVLRAAIPYTYQKKEAPDATQPDR